MLVELYEESWKIGLNRKKKQDFDHSEGRKGHHCGKYYYRTHRGIYLNWSNYNMRKGKLGSRDNEAHPAWCAVDRPYFEGLENLTQITRLRL